MAALKVDWHEIPGELSVEKTLVIQIAALGHEFLKEQAGGEEFLGLRFRPVESVFPAVTCSVQASFKTAARPSSHGMVGNGFFSRDLSRAFFWEQSSSLVSGERIWDGFRRAGSTVGIVFWQQSLGTDADVALSPAPIHKHHGGMIQDCFSRPAGLYGDLKRQLGRGFDLRHYWGPRTSVKSTAWIAEATARVMRDPAPDLLLTYLPHLDYDLQRHGPDSPEAARAFGEMKAILERLLAAARGAGCRTVAFGDYAMSPVSRPVHPNRALLEAGLMSVRRIGKMLYPDLYTSGCFCVVDHQVAHAIVRDTAALDAARSVLEGLPGVARVMGADEKREAGLEHPRAGDLVLVAERDAWFAYPWWSKSSEAPEYATHVDIHNKPSYDPCELFTDWWPFATSTDASRVRGSHGLVGEGLEATWASEFELGLQSDSIVGLARALGDQLDRSAQP